MKKYLICFLIALLATVGVSAQNLTGGVKVSAGFSNAVSVSETHTFLNDDYGHLRQSITIGGFLHWYTSDNFALQAGVDYNIRQLENSRRDFHLLSIPIHAIGYIPAGAGKVFIGAGPSIDLRLNSVRYLSKQGLSADVVAGYEFSNGIFVNGYYKHGLTNCLKAIEDLENSAKLQSVGISVGYIF